MTHGKKFGVTVYSVLIALLVITVAASCVQMSNNNIGSKYNNIDLNMQGAEVHMGQVPRAPERGHYKRKTFEQRSGLNISKWEF